MDVMCPSTSGFTVRSVFMLVMSSGDRDIAAEPDLTGNPRLFEINRGRCSKGNMTPRLLQEGARATCPNEGKNLPEI